jgi:hypothetical protein
MNARRSQLYLAHSCPPAAPIPSESEAEEWAAGMQQEDAAEYIAALLGSLRAIAVNAELPLLCDLLSVAEEEAKLHGRM